MRFQVVPESQPRSPACHRLVRTPAGNRAAVGAWGDACGLMPTAWGSQSGRGTAAPATPAVSAPGTAVSATPAVSATAPGSPASNEACVTSQLNVSLSNTGA